MELKIFTTFRTIVRTGSFTKAARLLSYTPSTITFHIAQLEKLTGVPLFEKSGRRMVLTKAGEALIPYVDEVLAAANKIKNFQYGIAAYQGTLTVGAPESLLCFRLPPLLKRLHAHAPRRRSASALAHEPRCRCGAQRRAARRRLRVRDP
ncbi:LysR family transcriptional regulator [uncultured Selenomonas sp.]|uniref:LysR family transcriptional regulator n=1 Tax=uncultured Selenomonas sp. TaxID=159275 RepID=UPI0028D1BEB4|nr:LysR family transcriptional regulator [uncultured Selenomonas sp.]